MTPDKTFRAGLSDHTVIEISFLHRRNGNTRLGGQLPLAFSPMKWGKARILPPLRGGIVGGVSAIRIRPPPRPPASGGVTEGRPASGGVTERRSVVIPLGVTKYAAPPRSHRKEKSPSHWPSLGTKNVLGGTARAMLLKRRRMARVSFKEGSIRGRSHANRKQENAPPHS